MTRRRDPRPLPRARLHEPPPGPSWWFDFELDRAHLARFRFLVFAVLAVDAFLQVSHAPRYGAAEFNVPHLSWLPLPSPGRDGMLAIQLGLAYLLGMAALGVATRAVLPIAAVLYNYAYFSSQLDSYQHHYLVGLLLAVACFVPWQSPEPRVRSWAVRLIMVQIAIVYLWAAIAKMHPDWIDGTTLSKQLHPKWIRDLLGDAPADYRLASLAVIVGELFLALAWLWRRLWLPGLIVGLGFHVGIELAGFRIGLFSYLMVACYSLLVPEWIAVGPGRALDRLAAKLPARLRRPDPLLGGVVLAIAIAAGAAMWHASPLPVPTSVVAGSALVALGAFLARRHWRVGVAHLAACALVFALGRTTDRALDYYKYWAGSSRRLGKADEMRRAYEALLAIEPGHNSANYYLGRLALEAGELDRALAHFRRAQAAEQAARAHVGEAQVLLRQGDRAGARAALDRALAIDPADRAARQLRAALDRPLDRVPPAEAPPP